MKITSLLWNSVAACALWLGLAQGAAAQVCVLPPADLIHWWPGDNSARDVQGDVGGTAIAASLANGAGLVPGYVRNAFSLNGVGAYVQVAPLSLTSGTIEFWAYPDRMVNDTRLFSQISGVTSLGGAMRIWGDGQVQVWTGFAWLPLSAPLAVVANTWTHFAFVYANGGVTLYINGRATGTQPSRFDFGPDFWGIGARFLNVHGVTFSGLVDEFSAFSRALTASEVVSIYAAQAGGKCRVPSADAGPDQTVNEGDFVTLDGSSSKTYRDAAITSYDWIQVGGPAVSLDLSDPVHPRFLAPQVLPGGATVTLQLTATNSDATSRVDTVDVTVANINHAPVAVAQSSAAVVNEGSQVQLDGTDSFDGDGETLTYAWQQVSGIPVTLSDPLVPRPTFETPFVGSTGAFLTFELTVSDGLAEGRDLVEVFVENVNHPPDVSAGLDQTVDEGTVVSLDARASTDPDQDTIQFVWEQTQGPAVSLSDVTSATPTFAAPLVSVGGALLTFRVVATDALGASSTDSVDVLVRDLNDPPSCSLARPTLERLWAPNHKMMQVGITGVTDPNDSNILVSIVGVTQDEPVNGLGDGDTGPDAVMQGATVFLRAERAGAGNGRVYRVAFVADDGQGGLCGGTVVVGVPQNIKAPGVIDDGPVIDSTRP